MIGATALAAVIGLGVAGYKGKLGKSVQKLGTKYFTKTFISKYKTTF
jgi:hypothetical protein